MTLLQRRSISQRLFALLLVCSVLTAGVGIFGVTRTSEVNGMLNAMYDNNLVPIADVANANMAAIYHNRALGGYGSEATAAERQKLAEVLKKHEARMTELLAKYRATYLTPTEVELLKKFDAAWPPYEASAAKVAALGLAGEHADAMRTLNGETAASFQVADDLLSDLVNLNVALGKKAYDESDAVVASSLRLTVAVIAAALLASIALGVAIARSITRPLGGEPADVASIADAIATGDLSRPIAVRPGDASSVVARMAAMQASLAKVVGQVRQSSDSIATGSAQIATGNADLSQRTEEQASNLQQTAASMEELTSTVRNNSDTAGEAKTLAEHAAGAASQGGEVVGRVVATMDAIAESSKKIADIIGVIDGIAFQTNILALNAAVEAARAGEQGRGFAVVASEVRSLAQRSANAAKEIKTLIGDSVEKVQIGSRQVNEAGASMADIVGQVSRVSELIAAISNATSEQSGGISQVADAVGQLDQVTQQNAALVEESAAAAESLRNQAARLSESVSVFKLG